MREAVDMLYDMINEIPCLTCPNKPEGSMVVLVGTNTLYSFATYCHWFGIELAYMNQIMTKHYN